MATRYQMDRRMVAVVLLAMAALPWSLYLGPQRTARAAEPRDPQAAPTTNTPPAPRPANPPNKVLIATSPPLTPQEQRETFALPPGFEIQLVASEPDIPKPMQIAFDEKGRLLVSGSRDYPLGPRPGEAPSDSLRLLEIDGDTGAATRITTFSTGYNICSGVEAMPGGRVILGHAPDILLLTDGDGDGVAEKSEVLYTGFARTDTHELPNSFTWGADGWLYALQGHVNESDVRDRAGRNTPIHHGNVFRMRPDGSAIEVWARGMSNPWGLTFDGEDQLFAADCESRPLWQIVGGLPYQGFLQDEEPLGFAPFITEDPHGASGFAGLVHYSARAFPESYRDCLYLGSPITGIIYRDRPQRAGSTRPIAPEPDFLTSTDPWFRPVDIELGPDGALYIADWYNRIIAHVEVPLDHPERDKERGRIWRVVYRGGVDPAEDGEAIRAQFDGPMARDWSSLDARALLDALGEPNLWIRRQAAAQLLHRFPARAVESAREGLRDLTLPGELRAEFWSLLDRAGALTADDLRGAARDPEARIRARAARMLGNYSMDEAGESPARDTLVTLLRDEDAIVSREAAMALAKTPDEAGLKGLIRTHAQGTIAPDDTLRAYATTFALREHLKEAPLLESVAEDAHESPVLLRCVAATPTARAARLQSTWIGAGHLTGDHRVASLRNILAYGEADVVAATFRPDLTPERGLVDFARTVFGGSARWTARLDLAALFSAWYPSLAGSADPGDRSAALEMALRMGAAEGLPLAREILANREADPRARQNAAKLMLKLDMARSSEAVLAVVHDVNDHGPARRAAAAEFAARVDTPERFDALLAALAGAPAEVRQGAAESLARQRPGVIYLLDAVERGDLQPGILHQPVVRILIDDVHKDPTLTARQRRLVASAESEESLANSRITAVRHAFEARDRHDPVRGQVLLEEHCLPCHRIGGFGGLRAPNLDGIGNRGIDRMLEDILQPSREIDPAFRSTLVTLKDGRTEEGFVTEEDDTWIVLTDATGWESEIRRDDIASQTRLWVSPMPPNFAETLPEADLLDIIAFLLNPPARIVPATEVWKTAQP